MANKLSLNISKTKYIVFAKQNKCIPNVNIRINNSPIERVHCFNFLGISIDSTLSWKYHVENSVIKLLSALVYYLD